MRAIWLMTAVLGCRGPGGVLIEDVEDSGVTTDTDSATSGPTDTADSGGPPTGQERYDAILELTGDLDVGAFLFAQHCGACHPAPGATNSLGYPPLEDVVPLYTVGQLVSVVVEGTTGETGSTMPAYGDAFTDQDVADVVAYVRLTYGAGR
jgi:mono/diheme cytochrome c family protein